MDKRYVRPQMAAIWSLQAQYEGWRRVEVAAAQASAAAGLIPGEAAEVIAGTWTPDVEEVAAVEAEVQHDLIAFTTVLARQLGSWGRFLHYGLTSNDVKDSGLALSLLAALDVIDVDLQQVSASMRRLAAQHRHTVMAGRTHGMVAEPITFGVKVAGWLAEVLRDQSRLAATRAEVATGKLSGAVGLYGVLPPSVEADALQRLGLRPEPVATQVVARDRHAMLGVTLAVIAGTVERVAVEIRHLQRTEVAEVAEPFGVRQKGSSAMPHKRNPEKSERLTGLARLVRHECTALLEDQALWHERDISHSSVERNVLPDVTSALDYMLSLLGTMLDGLEVYPTRMQANLNVGDGLAASERLLLAMVDRGLSREDAYQRVQSAAFRAWGEGLSFRELISRDPVFADTSPEVLDKLFNLDVDHALVDEILRRVGVESDR